MMPAKSFPRLVYDLMETHHQGKVLRMSLHSGLAYTTVWRWLHGAIRNSTGTNIRRLCRTYGLEERDVWNLIHRDLMLYLNEQPIPLPDLTMLRSGPLSRKDEARYAGRRRRLKTTGGGLLAGLSILISSLAMAGGSAQVSHEQRTADRSECPLSAVGRRRHRLAA